MYTQLKWRNCPSCKSNLVDAEISDPLKHTCEPGAFHSRLLGGINLDTLEIQYWKCPDCKTAFPVKDTSVIHTIND